MAFLSLARRSGRHLPALALAALSLAAVSGAALAQSGYREYDDGRREDLTDEDIRDLSIERGRRDHDEQYDDDDLDQRDDPADDGSEDFEDERNDGLQREGSLKDGDVADVSYFYEELENDGRWIENDTYGTVWVPHRVDADWRPYSRGHWAMTDDYGWFWVSDEPFGWATYHYGRWFHDRRDGWLWVPGTRWGPAWVAWRESDDYVGWAPLPPDAYWEPRRSTVVFRDASYESPEFAIYWTFLAPSYFTVSDPWRHYAPSDRVPYLVHRSRPHTHYAWRNRAIYNRGIAVERLERAGRRPIPRHHAAFRPTRPGRAIAGRDTIEVYRPDLSRRTMEARRRGRDIPGFGGSDARRVWRDVDRREARVTPEHRDRSWRQQERPLAPSPDTTRRLGRGGPPDAGATWGVPPRQPAPSQRRDAGVPPPYPAERAAPRERPPREAVRPETDRPKGEDRPWRPALGKPDGAKPAARERAERAPPPESGRRPVERDERRPRDPEPAQSL